MDHRGVFLKWVAGGRGAGSLSADPDKKLGGGGGDVPSKWGYEIVDVEDWICGWGGWGGEEVIG